MSQYESTLYQSEADIREARTRRVLYVLFGISLGLSALICSAILYMMLAQQQGRQLLGSEAAFTVGQVAEIPVDRLEITKILPNVPQWSEDIIFVIKQPDQSFQAFLSLDPKTGCKLNWRSQAQSFVDNCSQTEYSITGRNKSDVSTLSSQPAHMIELPVEIESGEVYVVDGMLRRDRR